MLEVGSWDEYLGDFSILVMSATARHALRRAQVRAPLCVRWTRCSPCPIDIIERHGGGSVRCMLAEVFLP